MRVLHTISINRIRAAFLGRDQVAKLIAERVRCCARPNVTLVGCPRYQSQSDCEYWERIAFRFTAFEPDNPDGWIVLGHSRFHCGNLDGACKAYRVASRLNDDAATWFSLGLCSTGDERVHAYRKALQHDSSDGLSWHYLGSALQDAGKYEEAIRCFSTAVEHSNEESAAWVLCDLGICHISAHQREKSIRAFERSVRGDGGFAFRTMSDYIAEACLPEPPEFTHALYLQIRTLAPAAADSFLRCFNREAARRGYIPVPECPEPTGQV
jgi:tetratricopeptide (TPR) repeat protein